jgi:tight adherence protein C
MTSGLILAVLAIATATMAFVMIIHELHIRALNVRVSKAVMGVPGQSAPFQDLTGWLSSLGMRYRRFYSSEDLEQLRAIVQSSGFNPHRTVPIWIGVKIVSMVLFPLVFLFAAELLGKPPTDLVIFIAIGGVIGIMGPRLILSALRRRFAAAVRKGTPDTIDLLVVCSEAGMGLESALERVAEEMNRSNPAMARVLYGLLDDLRILPNRQEAFEKLGLRSDGLRRFGAMMSQSLQYGTPLSQALRAIADELRRESITKLEERAHKLGAKLTIPMVLFMLPAMFIILGGSSFLHLTRAFQQFQH